VGRRGDARQERGISGEKRERGERERGRRVKPVERGCERKETGKDTRPLQMGSSPSLAISVMSLLRRGVVLSLLTVLFLLFTTARRVESLS
jgi:hypothetical protein